MMRAWKKFTVDLRQFENTRRNRDGHLIAAVPRCGGNSEFRREGWLRQFSSLKSWPLGLMLVLLVASPIRASQPPAEEDAFAPKTVGHWKGNARVVVIWSQQTNLCITLNIREDATVTGKVGDALLINGRLKKNRGWISQNLKVKTDYIVVGDLQGAIVAAEGITRARVKIPLNLSGETLIGGLHTCGSKFGGKDQMILSAAGLRLNRVQ